MKNTWMFVAVGLVVGCGSSSNNGGNGNTSPPPANNVITISGFTFSPVNLTVAPGSTVTVQNQDSSVHTVTSESAPGAFTPGAVNGIQFDTGTFTGTRTFTIPSTAQVGTVIPYYCQVHKAMMANRGQITIGQSSGGSDAGTVGTGY